MTRRGMNRRIVAASAALIISALALAPQAARADVSVEAGGAFNSNATSGQAALSLGLLGAPIVPVSGELTVAVPFNGGYATTLDARLHLISTTIGAGVGFGTMGNTSRTDAIFDGILAQTIAPHTAVEARAYFGANRPTTVFAGLRFSL